MDPIQQPAEQQMLPPPPASPTALRPGLPGSPSTQPGLQQEISFAALPKQQHGQQQERSQEPGTTQAVEHPVRAQSSQHSIDQGACVARPGAAATVPRLQLVSDAERPIGGEGGKHVHGSVGHDADDQVLFDAELASYISNTDYTDLRSAEFEVRSRGAGYVMGYFCV
jgi:hypothetical protein